MYWSKNLKMSRNKKGRAENGFAKRSVAGGLRIHCDRDAYWLEHHKERDAHARMEQIKQEIFAIDVVDVAIVGIGPVRGPRVHKDKRVAAVLESWLAVHDAWTLRPEGVASAKLSAKLVVRNMAALTCGPCVSLLSIFWTGIFLPS